MNDRRDEYNPAIFRHDPGASYPWQVFRRVTIAMRSWNRRELTERVLQALYRHAGMPFELLVVDNASTDGAAEMLEALAAAQGNVTVHRNPENVGGPRAFQQIRDLVPADSLVVYLDNDIEFLSSLFLVHLQKAFHAVRLAQGKPDAVFGIRLVNCEEHGFRHASEVLRFSVPTAQNGAPRTSFAAMNKDRAGAEHLWDEQVLVGRSDWILAGCWACPANVLKSVPYHELFPAFIGGDDGIASEHWAKLGIPMGYLENGPVARHLDWPYSEEKIALYSQLAQQRATTDFSYVLWKLRNFFR